MLTSDVSHTISTTLGFICVIVWAVAEIPQMITNYREKSTDGLSATFLITWMMGDIFNILGCLLEPATLPTQLYTALLYSLITLVLCSQAMYYGHIYPGMKCKKLLKVEAPIDVEQNDCGKGNDCGKENDKDAGQVFDDFTGLTVPVPVPDFTQNSAGSELCSQSPRYPPMNCTPNVEEPLLGSAVSSQSKPVLKIKATLCLVASLTLFGAFSMLKSKDSGAHSMVKPRQESVNYVGRKFLQVSGDQQLEHAAEGPNGFGTLFGWAMAIVYMAGRLPQICLNSKRGHTEGVNPLMFLLAIIGNGSYVASILVESLDWSRIRPNLPWLIESGGCVLLDCFIVMQFLYLRYWISKGQGSKHKHQILA